MKKYSIGIDYGTESARTILVDVETGETVGTVVVQYPDGVIEEYLPGDEQLLESHWALQNPLDWLYVLEMSIPSLLDDTHIEAANVIGLGVDFTSCTILPTFADGTPLCVHSHLRQFPHTWPKLWKHHAAQEEADQITELAQRRDEPWLSRYGGKQSSEWVLAKSLQILNESPEIYKQIERIVEGGDWVVWQLTGQLARNACAAGYKAAWHKQDGFPGKDFLAENHPAFTDLYSEKLSGPISIPGTPVGGLTAEWAKKLHLIPGMPVATPLIDAHSAVLGGGVSDPNIMFMIMGTSTCHMVMSEQEILVKGISGVVADGIIPGLYGYEAGQAAVGDIFAWFIENQVPPDYHHMAKVQGKSIHDILSEKAGLLAPGESGLLALDWWNGNRSTLVDAHLNGLLIGMTLSTKPEEIYRALVEATAFGTRKIIEAFEEQGIPIDSIVAGGGLTQNNLLMQIYADVTGKSIAIAGEKEVSALGAAMLGAVAARRQTGGYDTVREAVNAMAPSPNKVYQIDANNVKIYNELYKHYSELYEYFGSRTKMMKQLRKANLIPEKIL